MPKNPDKPTFNETIEWLKQNPEFHAAILEYLQVGRDTALSNVLKEHGTDYSDAKRNVVAALYSELYHCFQ